MKKNKSKLRGLHLWMVKTDGTDYWITTSRRSWDQIAAKARRVMREEGDENDITNIEYNGTLDA